MGDMYKILKYNSHLDIFNGYASTSTNPALKSKHGGGPGNSSIRISSTVEKCIMRLLDEENGTNFSEDLQQHPDFAIGITPEGYIAVERLSQKNERSILIYDCSPGVCDFMSCIIDTNTRTLVYSRKINTDLYLYALLPSLMEDSELSDRYKSLAKNISNGDFLSAWEDLFVISDNIYQRIRYRNFINFDTDNTENISGIDIENDRFIIAKTLYGTFSQLKTVSGYENKQPTCIKKEDFIGKYAIDARREYTDEEKILMTGNALDDYYIIGPEDVEICMDIQQTTKEKIPFRTFTLVGPPGTGKSSMVKAVANGIVQPCVRYTCHPNTEIFDFVGQVMPPEVDSADRSAYEFAAKIEELGGMSFKNIANVLKLPSADDVLYAPEEVYKDVTGKKATENGKAPTVTDALKAYTGYMTEQFNESIRKLSVASKAGSSFRYTETDFIKAVKNGWTVEIQEPTVILNEGVLVGLNGLLAEGIITLPTGKTIQRHRDNVVFFTTNVSLAGCRNMNQSLIDRSNEIFDVQMPSLDSMVKRAMSISGEDDYKKVEEMAKVILEISDDMIKSGIDDGVCGMRSLVNWAIKAKYMDAYKAGVSTVVNKATLDDESRGMIMKHMTESLFYRNYTI